MWAEKTVDVADARMNTSPAVDVRNVAISSSYVAKIMKEFDNAN